MAQLSESFPEYTKARVPTPAPHKPGTAVHACDANTLEVEVRQGVHGHRS